MNHCINNFLSINDNDVPLVFLDSRDKSSNRELILDNSCNDLSDQIDNLAKVLKREDYNQIALVENEIIDNKVIINIIKWFIEEDVFVVALLINRISSKDKELFNEILKYGVISNEEKYIRKNLNYKKYL